MKLGFRTDGKEKEIVLAHKLGFPVIELGCYPRTRPIEAEIAARLKRHNIGVSALLTGDEPEPVQLKLDMESTARYGARAFVSHPHPLPLHDADAHKRFQDLFGEGCEYAKKLGIRLAVHSCGLDPDQWDLMFALVPELGLKYDPSFSHQAGRNYRAEVVKYGPRIVHAHIKEERFMGRSTDFSTGMMHFEYSPAGTGDINWGSVIALLYEANYQGDLAIETHSEFWLKHMEWDLVISKRHIDQFLVD